MIEQVTLGHCDDIATTLQVQFPWSQVDNSNARVIVRDDEAVAILGYNEHWPGFVHVWALIIDERVAGHGRWFTRQVAELLDYLIGEREARQVRYWATTHDEIRWGELLGFELESVMRGAGPQEQDIFTMVFHRRH